MKPFFRKQFDEKIRDEDPTFFSLDPVPAELKKKSVSGSDLHSKWRKEYININHNFKLELVDSGLYFVQDENDNEIRRYYR